MIITIKDGKIINNQQLVDFMMGLQDREYEIKKYKRIRSVEQNRYYWGLLSIVEKETGIASEETHEKMRMKFLYVPENGVQLGYCKSTSRLNSTEFSEYIENVKNFMAQFGIILPSADQYESKF